MANTNFYIQLKYSEHYYAMNVIFNVVIFICLHVVHKWKCVITNSYLWNCFHRWVKQEGEFAKQANESPPPKLDLSFKEGQTIKINIGVSV